LVAQLYTTLFVVRFTVVVVVVVVEKEGTIDFPCHLFDRFSFDDYGIGYGLECVDRIVVMGGLLGVVVVIVGWWEKVVSIFHSYQPRIR